MKDDELFRYWLLDLNQRRNREGRPKLTKEQEEDFIEYMQRLWRLRRPDGCCRYCGEPTSQHFPTGPIVVTVSEPDDNGTIYTYGFCNWECLGHWAADGAGGTLIIDQN